MFSRMQAEDWMSKHGSLDVYIPKRNVGKGKTSPVGFKSSPGPVVVPSFTAAVTVGSLLLLWTGEGATVVGGGGGGDWSNGSGSGEEQPQRTAG